MEYIINGNQIQVILPITTPTGKVRVKRPIAGHAANPVACCTVPLAQGDYLEWQISYDTEEANAPSVVPGSCSRSRKAHVTDMSWFACWSNPETSGLFPTSDSTNWISWFMPLFKVE